MKASGCVSRRQFMRGLAVAGTLELVGLRATSATAEPSPETRRLRIPDVGGGICVAPQYVAEELMPGEGFSEFQLLPKKTNDNELKKELKG